MFTKFNVHKAAIVVATALVATSVAACMVTSSPVVAPAQPNNPPAMAAQVNGQPALLEIIATDHHFALPQQITAGMVTIRLKNEGQEPHHAQFARLNDSVTMEQFTTALQEEPLTALALVTFTGGPGVVDPNGEQTVTVELAPGQYVLLCFVPGADGVPHLAKGMIATLEVVAGDGAVTQPPQADAEVKLIDFSFVLPQELRAGQQVWKVTVDGKQPHEIMLLKLAAGKSMTDVTHWMHQPEGAPPFANVGGLQGIMPGATGYLHLDLTPGNYVALCHIPDVQSGKEHAELGMVMPFTVQ